MRRRRTFLIDMDGVLTKDKEFNPFPYATEFIENLKRMGVPFRIVSNNSTRDPKLIVDKLRERGFPLNYEDFISPVVVLPSYLKRIGARKIFVIGTELLRNYLSEEGFEVVEDHDVDAVVVGQDKELNFRKVKTAVSAVFLKGAKIVPVNLSRVVKDSDGLYFPGAGSVSRMIAHACRYEEELPNLGKPSEEFIKLALEGLPKEEVFIVSDDIYTDLMGAKDVGLKTVFMTTGKYPRDEVSRANFQPDHIFDDLRSLEKELILE